MTRKTVAKPLGLFQRNGVYQLRVMIPTELQAAFEGRTKIIQSLGTRDRNEARRLVDQKRIEFTEKFDAIRRMLNPQPVASLTPELGHTLGERIRAKLLEWDDSIRDDPSKARVWLGLAAIISQHSYRPLMIQPGAPSPALRDLREESLKASPLAGLTEAQHQRLSAINHMLDKAAGLYLARRHLEAVVKLADAEARKLGLLVDWQRPDARPVLLECLKAYRGARTAIRARDEGEDIPTPRAPTKAPQKKAIKLRDVFDQWKASKTRKEGTERAAERALSLYEEATGDPPIASLTRADGSAFRAWLLKQETTSKTARDRFDYVKGFLNFAARDLELIDRNPWEGLAIDFRTTNPRRPWSQEELQRLFSQPLFTRYEMPKDSKAGKDAAYWIPLLGLFTGARVSELAQLRPVDVETVDGVAILRILDEGEGQSLKTDAARRTVPIHSELIRLGFLKYAEAVKKSGSVSLWPHLRIRKEKPGDYFGRWFKTARTQEGQPVLPDFHSFRHTVRSKLAAAHVAEPTIDTLTGHEVKGSTGARVYTHRTVSDLKIAIERLYYSGLTLPRVSPVA